ncbi:Ribokinase [Actinomyces howellii]|uniref:Ribokinase n=1 Tax=Actinomyces howellii TaxID=52771 RepID=A0A3S4UYL5_9ACTO|nr:Ribokinase [Actinomyces howellii]
MMLDGPVNASAPAPTGLFCGLAVVDVVQLVDSPPGPDEKMTAVDQAVSAGGPATNAAVTFAALGGRAALAAPVGTGPLAELVRADLAQHGVELIDCSGARGSLSVSSCTVSATTAQRSVVSTNGRATVDADPLLSWARRNRDAGLPAPDTVLVDGHYPALARAGLDLAIGWGSLRIMDAGSWKDGAEQLIGSCDVVAPSARFFPPGPDGPLTEPEEVAAWLRGRGVTGIVLTDGARPVRWWWHDGPRPSEHGQVVPPQVRALDTLGAGDVFHGALAHALASHGRGPTGSTRQAVDTESLSDAVRRACAVAAASTTTLGARAWITAPESGAF